MNRRLALVSQADLRIEIHDWNKSRHLRCDHSPKLRNSRYRECEVQARAMMDDFARKGKVTLVPAVSAASSKRPKREERPLRATIVPLDNN